MFFVYEIVIGGVRRYVGYTNNIKRRQSQHVRDYQKGSPKYLYLMTAKTAPKTIYQLNVLRQFPNKGDAQRYEAYLILKDYFTKKELWQSFPTSFKYF
jgi:predicted GIY-YIG superfamily endonuclease